MLILPESDIDKARAVAAKVLKNIRNTTVLWDEKIIGITMSMGYGTFSSGMTIDDLIKQVDNALYTAKNAGRDQIAEAM